MVVMNNIGAGDIMIITGMIMISKHVPPQVQWKEQQQNDDNDDDDDDDDDDYDDDDKTQS